MITQLYRLWLLAAILFGALPVVQAQNSFVADTLTDAVFLRMQGRSFPVGCSIPRSDLRYLRVLHYDASGQVQQGELVCNKAIAQDLLDIFRQLYHAHYPIERMRLIDDYDADDEQSMRANNTSCFCFRAVSGSRKLSKHAQGLAIDINPLYNPYIKGTRVLPRNAAKYCNRKLTFPYKIAAGDLCHRLFRQHGFHWGGSWRSLKDYQHFEK
ncbi:MAG: M15 family metallopeptidase [Prevotella sp.]|nr:M15 family metallopeptidase [Prevotella sp.]